MSLQGQLKLHEDLYIRLARVRKIVKVHCGCRCPWDRHHKRIIHSAQGLVNEVRRAMKWRYAFNLAGQSHQGKAEVERSKVVSAAAAEQTIRIAGEAAYGEVLGDLARTLQTINIQIDALETQLATTLPQHPLADIVSSMPGLGVVLASEFIAVAGNPADHTTPARLASHAGFAPVDRDSGRVHGNLKRPKAFHRMLRRVFIMSSMSAIRHCPISNAYYRRKRAEGKTHRQAMGALARRRINVLWTMIQTGQVFRQRVPA